MFARLLGRGAVRGETKSFDDYEELVSLLDELSYREWQAFLIFSTHLDSRPADPNPLARVQPIWAAVVADFESQLGIAQAEASSFLVRIGRTGLLARSQAVTGTIKAVWA